MITDLINVSVLLFDQVGLPTGAVVTVEYGWEIYMNIYYRASPLDKFHTEGQFQRLGVKWTVV